MEPSELTTCSICGSPAELVEIYHAEYVALLCSWSCLMVYAAGRERDFRLHLIGLAERHSSALRTALAASPDAEAALNQLDNILSAIRLGA